MKPNRTLSLSLLQDAGQLAGQPLYHVIYMHYEVHTPLIISSAINPAFGSESEQPSPEAKEYYIGDLDMSDIGHH